MSALAKPAARRTLAIKRTRWDAGRSRDYWEARYGKDADVRVELGGAGSTPDQPYAITARKGGAL